VTAGLTQSSLLGLVTTVVAVNTVLLAILLAISTWLMGGSPAVSGAAAGATPS
jgi:hypothetical protein